MKQIIGLTALAVGGYFLYMQYGKKKPQISPIPVIDVPNEFYEDQSSIDEVETMFSDPIESIVSDPVETMVSELVDEPSEFDFFNFFDLDTTGFDFS